MSWPQLQWTSSKTYQAARSRTCTRCQNLRGSMPSSKSSVIQLSRWANTGYHTLTWSVFWWDSFNKRRRLEFAPHVHLWYDSLDARIWSHQLFKIPLCVMVWHDAIAGKTPNCPWSLPNWWIHRSTKQLQFIQPNLWTNHKQRAASLASA